MVKKYAPRKQTTIFSGIVMAISIVIFNTPSAFAATLFNSTPLISAGLPAYTSDDCFTSKPASYANSGDYSLPWRSCNNPPSGGTPVTLSYDISTIPSASRSNDVLVWFNDFSSGNYNPTLNNSNYYNTPKDYTVQGNTAAGGGTPPSSGWTTLSTVTANPYHSRQHLLNLSVYNWLRMSFTSSNGASLNSDISLTMDLHNAGSGSATDDWIFFGDSITQSGLLNDDTNGQTFAQQIHAALPNYYPISESGGIGGFTSSDALISFSTWLSLFPGKFVALNYGTNDANINASANTFYSNMATMVQDIITAGKVPIIPTIPWGCTANLTANLPTFNAKIQDLYTTYPQIIKGPDLYAYFQNNQSYIAGADCIHPAATGGWAAYRTQWAQAMVSAVYTAPTAAVSPSGGNVASSQTVTLTSTKPGTLYYTTDGSTPTSSSAIYATPLTISSTTTVKGLAVDQAGNQSDPITTTYTFPTSTPANNGGTSYNTATAVQPATNTHKTTAAKSTIPSSTVASTTITTTQVLLASPEATATPQPTTPTQTRTLVITLTDSAMKPLANVRTTLQDTGQMAITNADGIVLFYNVAPGRYRLAVNDARYTNPPTIDVAAGSGNQNITFKLAATRASHKVSPFILTSLMAVIVLIAMNILIAYRKSKHNMRV